MGDAKAYFSDTTGYEFKYAAADVIDEDGNVNPAVYGDTSQRSDEQNSKHIIRYKEEKTMEQKFNIGDKVAVSAVRDASAVGYLGCLGKVKIINNNKYFVSFFNSSNGAWFFHDELIKQTTDIQNTKELW